MGQTLGLTTVLKCCNSLFLPNSRLASKSFRGKMSYHVCMVFASAVLRLHQANHLQGGRDKRLDLQVPHITHWGEWRTFASIILLEFRPVSKHPYSKKIMSHSYWNLTFCSVSFKNPSLDFAFPNLFLVRMKTFTWSNLIFILSAICPSESRSWRVTNELDYMGGGFVGKNSLCQSPVLPFACERL